MLRFITFSTGSVESNIDFITKLAVQCIGGMLTFDMKIFIRSGRQLQMWVAERMLYVFRELLRVH